MTKQLKHVGIAICTLLTLSLSYGCTKTEGAAKGKELFGRCTSCHGESGEGKREILAPAIAGLPAWYVENQLEKFAKGWRGSHLNDVAGHRMRPMARTLVRPEGSSALISAYVASLPPAEEVDDMGGDIENGEALFGQCTSCHGTKGEGMPDATRAGFLAAGKTWQTPNTKCATTYNFSVANFWAPPLNNAGPWYIVEQLKKFKKKWRGNHECDHLGKQMYQWASNLSDRDMTDVAAYLHSLRATRTAGK
jgi:cytochrome c oxidase subunit II